jgi:hypothetical protein
MVSVRLSARLGAASIRSAAQANSIVFMVRRSVLWDWRETDASAALGQRSATLQRSRSVDPAFPQILDELLNDG